jgi:hypothetical protein
MLQAGSEMLASQGTSGLGPAVPRFLSDIVVRTS